MLYVFVCCSVLQCVTVCHSVSCSVLQCVAVRVCMSLFHMRVSPEYATQCVLQYVAVCCSVLQCVAVCCSELQCECV